jgi:hypothetical protein
MPYDLTMIQLPGGARCARVEWLGVVTGTDAAAMVARFDPGGPLHGLPLLVLGQQMEAMTPEARSLFSSKEILGPAWLAIVQVKAVARVMANFIMRMSGNKRRQVFADEAEALRWLMIGSGKRVEGEVGRALSWTCGRRHRAERAPAAAAAAVCCMSAKTAQAR